MRKVTAAVLAAIVAMGMATSVQAGGGTGAYEWAVSFSSTSPDSQVSPPLGAAPVTIYLWYTGCNAISMAGPGMSAAEMNAEFTGWTQFGFTPQNGYLNAGNATELLLAVGSCPTGPVVAGQWAVFGASGKVRLAEGSLGGAATTVDCDTTIPGLYNWPDQMRLVGCGTSDLAASLQDWGKGCTTDPVNPTTWGSVKSLYR